MARRRREQLSQRAPDRPVVRHLTPDQVAGFWSTDIHPWSYDFDYLGHLTAAIYPKAFEQGRIRYLAQRWGTRQPAYVVASHTMQYATEIREEVAPLRVLIRPTALGRSSVRLEEMLVDRNSRVCNFSNVTLVAWDPQARGPRELSPAERGPLELDMEILHGLDLPSAAPRKNHTEADREAVMDTHARPRQEPELP
ncbi:hypothetical protein MLGJGCBP_07454 [Rhodococcus sp. T7]|nr:hypothetical protein MLGJGCBP_07454 [Rhodococcus sp. T7]